MDCSTCLSITNSWSLLKLMSIESVIPSNHLILCRPLLLSPSVFPNIRVFKWVSFSNLGGQSIRVSASASVLPMNIQDWYPLGWTGWISLLSKRLSSLLQHHSSKASILQRYRRPGFNLWVRKIPWRREWLPTPVFLSGESHGQRSWWAAVHGVSKSWTGLSDQHFHFSLGDFSGENLKPWPIC